MQASCIIDGAFPHYICSVRGHPKAVAQEGVGQIRRDALPEVEHCGHAAAIDWHPDFLIELTTMTHRTITIIAALCALLFVAVAFGQVKVIGRVSYENMITEDEDGIRLVSPIGVLAEPVMKEIYVLSLGRVFIFADDLYQLYSFGKGRGVDNPLSLAVDPEGYVYITQAPSEKTPEQRVSVYNPSFQWERDIVVKGFEGDDSFKPYRLAVDGKGRIYVAGLNFPGVPVMDREGKILEVIRPEEAGEKVTIDDVAVDGNGRVYLMSADKGRVFVFDEKRELLFKFGQKGGSSTKLSRPIAIDVDRGNGRIYVLDYMRHTVLAYDNTGKYIFEFGGLGWSPGWFQYPTDLTVDSSGRIIIADTFNNRVEIFKPEGGEQ
jgi:DNA-binding beta-propeller fold protein YncE